MDNTGLRGVISWNRLLLVLVFSDDSVVIISCVMLMVLWQNCTISSIKDKKIVSVLSTSYLEILVVVSNCWFKHQF